MNNKIQGDDPFWDLIVRPCPHKPGTRVRLLSMIDDPCVIAAGAEGTVTGGNGGQIHVDWDNGRKLSMLVGFDRYEVLP